MEDYLTKKALKNDSLPELQRQSMLRLQSVSAVDGVLEFNYTSLGYIGEDAEYFRDWFKDEPIRFFWNGKTHQKVVMSQAIQAKRKIYIVKRKNSVFELFPI